MKDPPGATRALAAPGPAGPLWPTKDAAIGGDVYEAHVAQYARRLPFWGGLTFILLAPVDMIARSPGGAIAATSDVAAGLVTLSLGLAWRTGLFPHRHANAFMALTGFVATAAISGSSFLLDRQGLDFPLTEMTLGAIVVALSAFLLSWRWFLSVLLVACAGAVMVFADVNEASAPTIAFVVAMFAVGTIIHDARYRTLGATIRANQALEEAQRAARIGSLERDLRTGEGFWSPLLRELFELPDGVASLNAAQTAALVAPADRARVLAAYTDLAAMGTPMDERFEAELPSGARRVYRFRGTRSLDRHGRPVRIVATVQDETVQVAAQRLAEDARAQQAVRDRLAAVATLTAGAAHEYNNPLMYSSGALETTQVELDRALATPGLPGEVRAALENAKRATATATRGLDRIALITKALQQVTRTGGEEPAAEDATALVAAALSASAPLLPPGVSVRQRFEAKMPAKARSADTRAILAALITNAGDAVAAREGGRGTITLVTRDEGTDLVVEVSDDGPGVAPALQPRIFTPFFTTKARPDRPGLSLSIALQAARDQGGDLTFESPPGGGATFRLRLPQWSGPPGASGR